MRAACAACAALLVLAFPVAAAVQLPGGLSSQPLDPFIATAGEAANDAEQEVAVIVMKDRTFLPNIVTIRSGGTVWFVWADAEKSEHHSPRSSGSTGSASVDLSGAYVPPDPGACFNSELDTGSEISGAGSTYALTLAYDGAAARVSKSNGFFAGTPAGDLLGAEPLRLCPSGTNSAQGGAIVVPYHCKLHGFLFSGDQGQMKGAILVVP